MRNHRLPQICEDLHKERGNPHVSKGEKVREVKTHLLTCGFLHLRMTIFFAVMTFEHG